MPCLGFKILGGGFGGLSLKFGFDSLGFRVWDLGCTFKGSEFEVQGLGSRV